MLAQADRLPVGRSIAVARSLGDAEQTLGHTGGAAGVGRESIGADLVCIGLGNRSAADENLDFVAQPCFR